jgi:signal transduction histidine kinase
MKENLTAEDYKRELAELARFPDMNPGPVLRMNIDGKVLLSNMAAQKLFGLDLHGKSWIKICDGINPVIWQKIINTDNVFPFETTIKEQTFVFNHRTDYKSKLVFVFGTDITERKLFEKELKKQKEIIEEMARFPHMNPGPVLRMDFTGKILLSNVAAEKLFGEDLPGKNWKDICKVVNDELWHDVLSSEVVVPAEAVIDDKYYIFSHRCDTESKMVFVFGTDISMQRLAEKQLRQTEKMATLGTLAAGIAHEINNPAAAAKRASQQLYELFEKFEKLREQLSLIQLLESELLFMAELAKHAGESTGVNKLNSKKTFDLEAELEDWLNDFGFDNAWEIAPALVNLDIDINYLIEKTAALNRNTAIVIINWIATLSLVYELLKEINDCSTRISEIVLALKNYSFLDQAPVQNVDIQEGIENTLIILRNKLGDGIIINREYADNLPKITAFGSELNQVWTNLIENSIEVMNGKGTLIIRTRASNNFAEVEIEDSGPGIPKEIQSRIFDPFFTTKVPGKGTGLGLSTSYGIITEKHKGNISVESKPGMTKFVVSLPLS